LIQVNLLPGGKKGAAKSKGAGFSLKLPEIKGLPADKWTLGAAAAIIVALAGIGFLFMSVRSDREETQVALDEAVQDSARFADLIARTALLTARRDSIAQKVGIIQGIDQNRYIWPHLLDELSRALPDYTWLSEVTQTSNEPISVRLVGQAGNNFALTVFMEQLEASAFLQGVTLIQSQQELVAQQVVSGFTLEVQYLQPPMEFLQTVPLVEGTTATQTEAPDSAAAPAAPGN
jgi:Tfp pilus assembly protein PilN